MVSIDPFSSSIASMFSLLENVMAKDNIPGNLSGMLSLHFLLGKGNQTNIHWRVSTPMNSWVIENKSELDQAPLLAVLGCLLLENISNSSDENYTIALRLFEDGVSRLQQRQNIFTTPNSWILNSEVALGISLGVFSPQVTQKTKNWLKDILESGVKHKELPSVLRFTYMYGLYISGLDFDTKFETKEVYDLPIELAFEVWLVKRYSAINFQRELPSDWLESSMSKLLEQSMLTDIQVGESWKAAILWHVLSDYIHSRSQFPKLDLITSILSNFDAAMERWDSKWKIENEYDIQGILWLVLRTVFDDLRYEESFPKLGRSGHRYDIAVPQLGLIIEVKYTRASSDFQKILDEVSKDAVQINTQAVYKDIMVFVYDESCSVEQYAWAKNAIESIDRIKGCVIKSAPSTTRTPTKIARKKK